MELASFEVKKNDYGFVHLRNPVTGEYLMTATGEGKTVVPLAIGVNMYGIDSPQFKKHQFAVQNQELESRRKGNKGVTAEDLSEVTAIRACFHSFVNCTLDGRELSSVDDLEEFLDRLPWAQEQLINGIGSRENFMPALSKKS